MGEATRPYSTRISSTIARIVAFVRSASAMRASLRSRSASAEATARIFASSDSAPSERRSRYACASRYSQLSKRSPRKFSPGPWPSPTSGYNARQTPAETRRDRAASRSPNHSPSASPGSFPPPLAPPPFPPFPFLFDSFFDAPPTPPTPERPAGDDAAASTMPNRGERSESVSGEVSGAGAAEDAREGAASGDAAPTMRRSRSRQRSRQNAQSAWSSTSFDPIPAIPRRRAPKLSNRTGSRGAEPSFPFPASSPSPPEPPKRRRSPVPFAASSRPKASASSLDEMNCETCCSALSERTRASIMRAKHATISSSLPSRVLGSSSPRCHLGIAAATRSPAEASTRASNDDTRSFSEEAPEDAGGAGHWGLGPRAGEPPPLSRSAAAFLAKSTSAAAGCLGFRVRAGVAASDASGTPARSDRSSTKKSSAGIGLFRVAHAARISAASRSARSRALDLSPLHRSSKRPRRSDPCDHTSTKNLSF